MDAADAISSGSFKTQLMLRQVRSIRGRMIAGGETETYPTSRRTEGQSVPSLPTPDNRRRAEARAGIRHPTRRLPSANGAEEAEVHIGKTLAVAADFLSTDAILGKFSGKAAIRSSNIRPSCSGK